MQYFKATKIINITYGREDKGDLIIKKYSDSHWARDYTTKKVTLGFVFILNSGPVS